MKKVVVITGPTGIGKTAISIEVAKYFNMQIISADSAQVYKRLNIGTAKITEAEKQGIIHHLIDIVEPNEHYDVARFQKEAREIIKKLEKPLIVGGTGLYINAVLHNYDFSSEGRCDLFEEKYLDYNNEELYNLLKKKDFQTSLTIHPNNRRKVLRALFLVSKEKINIVKEKDKPLYDYLIFKLEIPRDKLYERINNRVDKMLELGLVGEVKKLKEEGFEPNIISYKQIGDYLKGLITYGEAINDIKKTTRRYAKRQETWFKNQMVMTTIDATNPLKASEEIILKIKEFYERK